MRPSAYNCVTLALILTLEFLNEILAALGHVHANFCFSTHTSFRVEGPYETDRRTGKIRNAAYYDGRTVTTI